jgi:hypothetical protein
MIKLRTVVKRGVFPVLVRKSDHSRCKQEHVVRLALGRHPIQTPVINVHDSSRWRPLIRVKPILSSGIPTRHHHLKRRFSAYAGRLPVFYLPFPAVWEQRIIRTSRFGTTVNSIKTVVCLSAYPCCAIRTADNNRYTIPVGLFFRPYELKL